MSSETTSAIEGDVLLARNQDGGLTEEMLRQSRWHYGHDGTLPSTEDFQFLPGGRVGGYDHQNEQRWQLDSGVLSLLDWNGQVTVRFEDIRRDANDALVLRGKYLLDPSLNIVLKMAQVVPQIGADRSKDILGYSCNDGGITNQKLALLGLFKTAYDSGRPIMLPEICIMDQVQQSRRTVPFESVFDVEPLKGFAQVYGIALVEGRAREMPRDNGRYFTLGCACVSKSQTGQRPDRGSRFPVDFVRALEPIVRKSYLLRKLKDDVFKRLNVAAVAQFRLEADWKAYSDSMLVPRYKGSEDFCPTAQRIGQKIANTLPGMRRIYVASDEAAMLSSKAELRAACKSETGIELLWKSDLLGKFELELLTPLELSLIDFEMALYAKYFIGMTRSTFSNMVTFEKYSAYESSVRTHYIYNTSSELLVLRTDNGTHVDPALATRSGNG